MNYKLLFLFVAILYFIFGVISPTIRNLQKLKNGIKPEKNLGGSIAKKNYKKNRGMYEIPLFFLRKKVKLFIFSNNPFTNILEYCKNE